MLMEEERIKYIEDLRQARVAEAIKNDEAAYQDRIRRGVKTEAPALSQTPKKDELVSYHEREPIPLEVWEKFIEVNGLTKNNK